MNASYLGILWRYSPRRRTWESAGGRYRVYQRQGRYHAIETTDANKHAEGATFEEAVQRLLQYGHKRGTIQWLWDLVVNALLIFRRDR